MSVEQIEKTLLQLPREERRRFADWFYAHEDELAGPEEIHPDVKTEILRRRDEALAHPELMEPVTDEWFEQLKHKLADAPSAKASAR
jgi:hypothetical protein